jgi:hypothetical protein
MPTSEPPSNSRPARVTRGLRRDEAAVTEVLSYILTFGILSVVLVMSLVAFESERQEKADDIARLQADAAAQQVSSIIVETSLFRERQTGTATMDRILELPYDFEGRNYKVRLLHATASRVDQVQVEVPGIGYVSTSILFEAGAASSVNLCEVEISGGPLRIRHDANSANYPPGNVVAPNCIFLEEYS